jgi:hypothetical protein
MKTSILQSMLSRNKEIIDNLHYMQRNIKGNVKAINVEIKSLEGVVLGQKYICSLLREKSDEWKLFQKNSKSLKQLAEIQKAIKEEIRTNDAMEAYVVWLAKRGV